MPALRLRRALRQPIMRLMLPPLARLDAAHLTVYVQDSGRDWVPQAQARLQDVAARHPRALLDVSLHPSDLAMATLPLPPLSPAMLRKAVWQAVAARSLGPLQELAIGHGQRCPEGRVSLAWTQQHTLQTLHERFRAHGLRLRAIYPSPAFLDISASPNAALDVDGWVVLRQGAQHGGILPPGLPLPPDHAASTQEGWPGPQGAGWNWTLVSAFRDADGPAPWGTLVAWGCLAFAVAVIGLRLEAGRMERAGQAVRLRMVQAVQAAFPNLTVVLDPVRQARQQREAQSQAHAPTAGLGDLLQAAAAILPQARAQIQSLDYQAGRLDLNWRDGAQPGATRLAALREQAAAHQLELQSLPRGLSLRPAAPTSEPAP